MSKRRITLAFWIALPVIAIIVLLAIIFQEAFANVTGIIRSWIGNTFGWYYLILVSLIIFVCFFIIVNPAGKIRLGDPKSKPEHKTISWIAMLFSAGMGIGLIFYGAAEPLSHYAVKSPEGATYSSEALSNALKYSFFHYGIHAWSIFAIVALSLAYFMFRKKEKGLISSTLRPLFGDKMDGIWGKIIDSITIIATVAGVATSLGFGAAQINGGLSFLWNAPTEFWVQLIIIVVATVLFLLSACSGIGKGVKLLSNINIVIAVILMFVVLFVGPTVKALNSTTQGFGEYLRDLLFLGLRTGATSPEEQEWIQQWTLLYWSWWISWAPFVGVFIARISKGRTIREFLTCVILVPTVFSVLWFGIFGTLSTSAVDLNHEIASLPLEEMLFATFNEYPLSSVLSFIAIILIFSFFITSADSATYVLAMQAEGGKDPKKVTKIVLGSSVSLIAAGLLFAGGLDALQNVLIIIAFPFSFIIILLVLALLKELAYEKQKMGLSLRPKVYPEADDPFKSYEPSKEEKKQIRHEKRMQIKEYLKENETITTQICKKELNISIEAAARLLHKMVEEDTLELHKQGKKNVYSLKGYIKMEEPKKEEALKVEEQNKEEAPLKEENPIAEEKNQEIVADEVSKEKKSSI